MKYKAHIAFALAVADNALQTGIIYRRAMHFTATMAHKDEAVKNRWHLASLAQKRDPNRRIYFSNTSKQVCLTDIKQMICNGLTSEIVDSKMEEFLTRSVLVYMIAQRHPGKIAMLLTAMLDSIFRAKDEASDVMVRFLCDCYSQLSGVSGRLLTAQRVSAVATTDFLDESLAC